MSQDLTDKQKKILEQADEMDMENPFRSKDPSEQKFSNADLSNMPKAPIYEPSYKNVDSSPTGASWINRDNENKGKAQVAGAADRVHIEGDPARSGKR